MQEPGESHQTLVESLASKVESPASKALSDAPQSLDTPGLSSGKSKKRERPDQITLAGKKDQSIDENTSPQKRECVVTLAGKKDHSIDEYTSPQKRECIERLVDDGGGLTSMASVDQLIYNMKQEKSTCLQRRMAAKVLVGTSKDVCLQKFVDLGGVSILKEWIEEGTKIRSSDTGMKDGEKGLDEELVVILQALEKLPISPETLKGCSIGKSVKQLRSVRNGEVQKRARKLVDTWRKRVDVEVKQSSTLPSMAPDPSQHADSTSCVSDLCPGKGVEALNAVAVKSGVIPSQEESATVEAQTLVSSPSSPSTFNASINEHVKAVISPVKDTSKKTARLSASSGTSVPTLSPAKRQKHSATLAYKDCKDEGLNTLECQKLREKDSTCENSSSHVASDTAVRKTNEYRKKLRSGSSTAVPCSSDSHTTTLPSNAVHTRDNTTEKVACSDTNMGDSEQQHGKLPGRCLEVECLITPVDNEAPDPPGINNRGAGNKDEAAAESHPQDGKTDPVSERCLSSQSSCTEKRKDTCPKVVLMVEKTMSPTPPLKGDTSVYRMSNVLSEQTKDSLNVKEGLVQLSTKSVCSENDYPGKCAQKLLPKAEPNSSSGIMANRGFERNELAHNVTHVGEICVVEGESSCCSHNTQQVAQVGGVAVTQHDVNVRDVSADHRPSHHAIDGGTAALDRAVCSESTMVVVNACQGSEKENAVVALSHGCIDDANKQASAPSLAANGNKPDKVKHETDVVHTRTSEIPAVTHSCHDFDLNEGIVMDEFMHDVQPSCGPPSASISCQVMKVTGTLSAPIAISAASKGVFIPPLIALCKSDVGWTGSAATSAFRPAEPRHLPVKTQPFLASSINEARHVNSFDLNVADQSSFEDCPPSSAQGMQEAHFDLNNDGKEIQSRISAASDSDTSKHLAVGSPRKHTLLDFDLNEQLDEVPQEQEVLLTSAAKSYGGPISFRGLSGLVSGGDIALWNSAQGTVYPGASANGPRVELFGSASQPTAISSRQVTPTTIPPPPVSSLVYSQTAPFFGGLPPPSHFPASFSYDPMSVGPDTSFMASRTMPGIVASSVGARSRPETSVRPGYVTNIDDLRGGNSFYTWGRAPQNIYGNSGATIISYNDPAVGGREHVVNYDGNASFEEQMRLFQQAAVPVTSMKRRDPEFFPGLKQTTWH